MTKPKIALCFSGQLRCHHKLVEHWVQHVILPLQETHEVVLFFYLGHDSYFLDTWNIVLDYYKPYELNIVCQTELDKDFQDIVPRAFELHASGLDRGHNQLIRELYFMDQVIALKRKYEQEHDFRFDYVIRTRPDCLPERFDPRLLNLVGSRIAISDHDHHEYLNARFVICNSVVADEIFTIIDHFNETIDALPPLINKGGFDPNLKYFAGEYFWKTHLSLFDINIELIPYNVYLVRDYDPLHPHSQHYGHIFLNGESKAKFESYDVTIPLNII
jgi:hypothetical protein